MPVFYNEWLDSWRSWRDTCILDFMMIGSFYDKRRITMVLWRDTCILGFMMIGSVL